MPDKVSVAQSQQSLTQHMLLSLMTLSILHSFCILSRCQHFYLQEAGCTATKASRLANTCLLAFVNVLSLICSHNCSSWWHAQCVWRPTCAHSHEPMLSRTSVMCQTTHCAALSAALTRQCIDIACWCLYKLEAIEGAVAQANYSSSQRSIV